MNISVVVTCYNEEKNIARCIESLLRQDYSDGAYEIIVSDGGSRDATQAIVSNYAGTSGRVRLVIERKKGTAAGRNAGLRAASYGYVAFTDADCEAPSNWLTTMARGFIDAAKQCPVLAAVGGRNVVPHDSNSFVRAIEVTLDSFPGSFRSIQGRQFKHVIPVCSVSTVNALYDKVSLESVGCFDESLASEAEDADVNYRLQLAGHNFVYIPKSFVWHRMRSTPYLWMKNVFRYGRGRARLLKRHPGMRNVMFILPILFFIAMALVPAGFLWPLFFLPLVYFPVIFLYSLWHAARKGTFVLAGTVSAVYIIQHFAYAAGEVYGLIQVEGKRKKEKGKEKTIA